MSLNERLEFVIKFLLNPKSGWGKIGDLSLDAKQLAIMFLIPLAAIIGFSSIIGGVIWSHYGVFNLVVKGIALGAEYMGTILLAYYILSKLINSFEAKDENFNLLKLTLFSFVPVFIFGSLAFLVSPLSYLFNILCLTGIYYYWQGALRLLGITEERAVGFVFLSLIIIAAALAVSMLFIGGFFSIFL